MSNALRQQAGRDLSAISPKRDEPDAAPRRTLRLAPDFPAAPQLPPEQADALSPVHPRMAVRPDRRQGSFATYVLFLVTGAAVGIAVAIDFLTGKAGHCHGADAPGQCMMDALAAPALTRFALVLFAAHAAAILFLDVVPDVRAKLRAGYRPRRAPRAAPVVPLRPGEPVSLLAAACWTPVQAAPATPRPASTRPRGTVRAVCRPCSMIVDARAGRCCDCGQAVVARRG